MDRPTSFEELNALLDVLVERAVDVLEAELVGVYLLGSFALGAATLNSDVDFLVVTRSSPDPRRERQLRAVHDDLHDWPTTWAKHLEGSYAPREQLRRIESVPSPWLYLDNGSRELEQSTHCNTAITRRVMRRCGLTLWGTPATDVVEEVSDADLRSEARRLGTAYANWLANDWSRVDDAWRQPYTVATLCRMLATITTGQVVSKPEALQWGLTRLPPQWSVLLEDARADLGRQLSVGTPARSGSAELTKSFVAYALASAGRSARAVDGGL